MQAPLPAGREAGGHTWLAAAAAALHPAGLQDCFRALSQGAIGATRLPSHDSFLQERTFRGRPVLTWQPHLFRSRGALAVCTLPSSPAPLDATFRAKMALRHALPALTLLLCGLATTSAHNCACWAGFTPSAGLQAAEAVFLAARAGRPLKRPRRCRCRCFLLSSWPSQELAQRPHDAGHAAVPGLGRGRCRRRSLPANSLLAGLPACHRPALQRASRMGTGGCCRVERARLPRPPRLPRCGS